MKQSTVDFTGFVLAGGKSSRMGSDKAFLEIEGQTFLERSVCILIETCAETTIVINQGQTAQLEKLSAEMPYIFDVFENRGPLGGLHTAFLHCRTEFAVVLAVDLPFVSPDIIKFLQKTALEFHHFSAFVPLQNDGRPQPLCAIYKPEVCLKAVENLLKTKQSPSVRTFLAEIPTHFFQIEQSEETFFNINHPGDFQTLSSKYLIER